MRVSIKNSEVWQEFSNGPCKFLVSPAMPNKRLRSLAACNLAEIESKIVDQAFDDVTILVVSEDRILYKPDIVNRRPVFYTQDGWFISDKLSCLPSNEFDLASIKQYVLSGYVTGSATFFMGVRKSQAGELLCLTADGFRATDFFGYRYSEQALTSPPPEPAVEADLFRIILNDVIRALLSGRKPGQQVVIPLSGGHDSRLLLNQIAELGYKDVVCFSYGTRGNDQSAISEKVATSFGYPWHFVEYTEDKWAALHSEGVVKDYCEYAHRGGCTPHLQDFLAVSELLANGIIQAGDLVVPGHTLDFLSGGHVGDQDFACDNKRKAVDRVIKRHFPGGESLAGIDQVIRTRIEDEYDHSGCEPQFFQEWFNWRERQCKFIVNSCAAYEFHGLNNVLPFWDSRVVRYWLRTAPKIKSGRAFFFEMERCLLDKRVLGIPFAGSVANEQSFRVKVKGTLRSMIPKSLTSYAVRVSRLKRSLGEGLNMVFANSGDDIRSALPELANHACAIFPPVRVMLPRRPYQVNGHKMAALYTLNMLIGQQCLTGANGHKHEVIG